RLFCCDTMKEFMELTGNSFKGMVHPEDLDAVEKSIEEQIATSQYDLDYVEYRIIQKNGNICWIEDYGHFIHSETAGDIFYVFIADATEKRELRQKERAEIENKTALKEQLLDDLIKNHNQEQLQRLKVIEGLGIDYDSIYYVNLDKNIIHPYRLSHRMEYLFEHAEPPYPFAGFDADYIQKWVHPDDRYIVLNATNPDCIRERLSGRRNFHVNYRIVNGAETGHLELHIVNVGSNDHISQIVMGYRSIDAEIIQKMEQREMLEYALNQAQSANIARNTFLSNMSHDLRTPMNAIVGFTALAKNHIDDKEKVQGYLNMIEESSTQLLQLINAVLELSRMESGKIIIETEKCNLIDIVHEVQTAMLPRALEKNITLSLDISGLKHYIVYGDTEKLTQTLLRLTNNAVKYTNPNGKITVTVTELGEPVNNCAKYRFVIKDSGIGISQKFMEHIFEPFEREKNTTLSGVHGTGLGLTIAKNTIEMMGGTIEVDSNIGEGSSFTVTLTLPIHEQVTVSFYNDINTAAASARQHRILIVEDTEINLEIEAALLEDAGFLVDSAVDGKIALEKVRNSEHGYYSLILMDIQMPVMNGYNSAKAIRKIEDPMLANIPIIALSANTFDEDRQMSKQCGMNAHLGKPLNMPELLETITKTIQEAQNNV
ncbi:MAG: response regulator, partial [Lachnospiraceae bacterium]|nr:response regulator [Lachnospiraceae bacterium]